MTDQPNLGAPAAAEKDQDKESSNSALGASVAKAAAESDGTKSPVPAAAQPDKPIVFGGQFQDVAASETVKEGETRNYVDEAGRDNIAEIVGSHTDGTVDVLVDVSVGRIRRDNVPWKKEGMKGGYVE